MLRPIQERENSLKPKTQKASHWDAFVFRGSVCIAKITLFYLCFKTFFSIWANRCGTI